MDNGDFKYVGDFYEGLPMMAACETFERAVFEILAVSWKSERKQQEQGHLLQEKYFRDILQKRHRKVQTSRSWERVSLPDVAAGVMKTASDRGF